jgi:hypothetical protein
MEEDDAGEFRLDRSHFSVVGLDEPSDAVEYWASRPPAERLRAMEYLRRIAYGTARATERLQRLLQVVELDG